MESTVAAATNMIIYDSPQPSARLAGFIEQSRIRELENLEGKAGIRVQTCKLE